MPGENTPTVPQQNPSALPWWASDSRSPLLDPSQVRTRTIRGTIGLLTAALVLTLGLGWVLRGTEVSAVQAGPLGSQAHRQTMSALVGGCGPRYVFPDTLPGSGIITSGPGASRSPQVDYATIVPVFGPFWDAPAPTDIQRVWLRGDATTPRPENLLYNQWRGELVAYYTAQASAQEVATLTTLATRPDLGLVVVPWPRDRGTLPAGRTMALATWGATQTCHRVVAAAVLDFRAAHPAAEAPGAGGVRPPLAR